MADIQAYDTIQIHLKLYLFSLQDEKNEILSLNMWVIYRWKDVNLQWNPVEFGGVDMLYVPSELIWLPDVVLYNK